MKHLTLTTLLTALAFSSTHGQEKNLAELPKYQTPVPYAGDRHWHLTQNLGATGARGWVYGDGGHSRESREILIKSIEPGSPADGVLQIYDVIVGAAVPPNTPSTEWREAPELKPFDSDARLSLARAITWTEGSQGGGQLKLLVNRNGKVGTAVVKIPVMGDYSETAPFDCPKSERIAKEAAAFLAENMPVEGFGEVGKRVAEPKAAAFLLASGDDRYLDHVRRSAYQLSIKEISTGGHETWRWGNTNLFLAEYYLATGDKRVLPTIEGYCNALADGQANPGTWGHKVVPDFIPPGYGSVNSTGVVCFLSIVLGDQCGVDFNKDSIRNSIRFYGSYVGRGGIPYGDHEPYPDATGNGKNGGAALAFHLLGAEPAAQWFARMACSTNLSSFENGHTGNYFNQTWTPLGASLAGRENYVNFWARFNSYRDLARRRDGSFMTQPWPQKREGDLGWMSYINKGPVWSTGGFALSYLADSKRLAILGRTDSVFAVGAPPELKGALDLYHAKKFEESIRAAAFISEQTSDTRVLALAKQLAEAAQRNLNSIGLTLKEMNEALAAEDLYKLKWQLLGIESVLHADDPRLQAFRKAIEDPDNEEQLAKGADFYVATTGQDISGPKVDYRGGFDFVAPDVRWNSDKWKTLVNFGKHGPEPYRQMARNWVKAHPEMTIDTSESLLLPPATDKKAACWRYLPDDQPIGDAWKAPGFSERNWLATALPSKEIGKQKQSRIRGTFEVDKPQQIESMSVEFLPTGPFQVLLNGTLVLDYTGSASSKNRTTILLKPVTRELLKPGENCLAIESDSLSHEFYLSISAGTAGRHR